MTSLTGPPKMHRTRTTGLWVGWKQGLHEKDGVGVLHLQILKDNVIVLQPVPRKCFRELLKRPDAEAYMNDLLRMYGA